MGNSGSRGHRSNQPPTQPHYASTVYTVGPQVWLGLCTLASELLAGLLKFMKHNKRVFTFSLACSTLVAPHHKALTCNGKGRSPLPWCLPNL